MPESLALVGLLRSRAGGGRARADLRAGLAIRGSWPPRTFSSATTAPSPIRASALWSTCHPTPMSSLSAMRSRASSARCARTAVASTPRARWRAVSSTSSGRTRWSTSSRDGQTSRSGRFCRRGRSELSGSSITSSARRSNRVDRRAARVRRPGRSRGQGPGRERPARGRDGPDRARPPVAGERAPDRRFPAADPERAFLTRSASRRPLRPPALPRLPSDLLRVLRASARVEAPLEPAELPLELAPAVEALA